MAQITWILNGLPVSICILQSSVCIFLKQNVKFTAMIESLFDLVYKIC